MRLLLDLQCVQSTSSRRGIGRYALCLAQALVQTAGTHQVEVLLNSGDDPERLLRARTALETFLPARCVHVFDAAWPFGPGRTPERRAAAEAARTAAVRSLCPDAVLVGSVFEGDVENVSSIDGDGASPPTAALLFDLIPAADPGTYLLGPGADDYWRRFEHLRRADLLLSISDYAARQGRELVGPDCPATTTIWGGPYPSGAFPAFEERVAAAVTAVPPRFLLAVGGDHPRKNLDRLVTAWGLVPPDVRNQAPLVVACRLNVGTVRRLRRLARRGGLAPTDLVLTGEVSEDRLAELYDTALAFVFPSTEEGLGMPPLEAMWRGCPTVLARSSSLVELTGDPRAFFDPLDVVDLARMLAALVTDPGLREHLRGVAAEGAARFTWTRSATLAWTALEGLVGARAAVPEVTAAQVVDLDDAAAIAVLDSSPAAVRVTRPLPDLPPAYGRLPLTPDASGLRAALLPATALVTDELSAAVALVAAGLVEQPIVPEQWLDGVYRHDLLGRLAGLLDAAITADLADDVVRAVRVPPRWTLERPGPVLLLLHRDDTPPPGHGLVAVGGPLAVGLAACVDHVLVEGSLVGDLLPELHRARCRGTGVHAVGPVPVGTPAWIGRLDNWSLDNADVRTGWPWRDGA